MRKQVLPSNNAEEEQLFFSGIFTSQLLMRKQGRVSGLPSNNVEKEQLDNREIQP